VLEVGVINDCYGYEYGCFIFPSFVFCLKRKSLRNWIRKANMFVGCENCELMRKIVVMGDLRCNCFKSSPFFGVSTAFTAVFVENFFLNRFWIELILNIQD